ncbi:uncharacterized protein B0H18DRAFT_70048 [Fomitopsis serialis]|uniref:uncharacterized protein n=1 Tax=Fomitopsis serialis TaxID=139415 RepID=UPI0020076D73|nr:uncharacterized protein B0H18DRAFT_70048 [Neoantrodia serialis]KAH9931910.1 hypothetical protein B0H18DRAFT_70048 [Neoantrodia serialis]
MSSSRNWLGNIADKPAALRWAAEASEKSSTFSTVSESLQLRRANVKRWIEEFVKEMYDITADDFWTMEDIGLYFERFLSLRAKYANPSTQRRRNGHQRITYSTLRQWKDVVVYLIYKFHPKGAMLLSQGLFARLYQHITFLQRELEMDRHLPLQEGFGRLELRILTERLYAQATDPLWANQTDITWKLCFVTGCRPGSIGATYASSESNGFYMKIRDLHQITRVGYMQWNIQLHINVLKGYSIGEGKRIVVMLRPVTSPMNVVFDVTLLIVMNLFMRGMLYHSTWQAVCDDETFQLNVRPEYKNHPLICKGKNGQGGVVEGEPMRSSAMQEIFARFAGQCGFKDARLYNFRRDFAADMMDAFGEEETQQAMGHTPGEVLVSLMHVSTYLLCSFYAKAE